MDLIATHRDKIDRLEEGEYLTGLRAVLLHVETAFRHLSRGEKENDDTAFTDAIYRTNQAFEGGIKEAYRVLAEKDPSKRTPFEIETYLEENRIFRSRVLNQFTNYRTEWRNPSTHDHILDFDNSEAFLAIVSVTAFVCLLLNEISGHLSFLKSKAEAESKGEEIRRHISGPDQDLTTEITRAIQEFAVSHQYILGAPRETETQITGALHGFLITAIPNIQVVTEAQLAEDRHFRADLLIRRGNESIVLEVKRRFDRKNYHNSIAQVEHYMMLGNIKKGVLLFLPEKAGELIAEEHLVKGIGGQLFILKPMEKAQQLKDEL